MNTKQIWKTDSWFSQQTELKSSGALVSLGVWILLIINRLAGQEMTHTEVIFRRVPEVTLLL